MTSRPEVSLIGFPRIETRPPRAGATQGRPAGGARSPPTNPGSSFEVVSEAVNTRALGWSRRGYFGWVGGGMDNPLSGGPLAARLAPSFCPALLPNIGHACKRLASACPCMPPAEPLSAPDAVCWAWARRSFLPPGASASQIPAPT